MMKETVAMTTKMPKTACCQPWNGCLVAAAISPASAALAAVTAPNHAATLPPQSNT
jgi:hypothetical protein